MDTVIWPPTLALVRSENRTAYTLRLLKGVPDKTVIQVKALPIPQGFLAFERTYTCSVTDAHYLAGVHVRPLEGRRLPKGSLRLMIDGEVCIHGSIASFVPDPEPLDCSSMRRFKKTENIYTAHTIIDGQAMESMQIGFMLIHNSKVEVYLSELVAEEAVPLEITLIVALYTTKKAMP